MTQISGKRLRGLVAAEACLTCFLVCSASVAWAGDGIAALRTADPSCPDNSGNIYVDCGNGTVTDNRTGLVWLKTANCLSGTPENGVVDWYTAMDFVAGLSDLPGTSVAASQDCGLSDSSSPGEWRLPSVEEWEAMMADAQGDGGDPDCSGTPPMITNDSGLGCWLSGPSSFTHVLPSRYWSSSADVGESNLLWTGELSDAGGGLASKGAGGRVWPVRGGQ